MPAALPTEHLQEYDLESQKKIQNKKVINSIIKLKIIISIKTRQEMIDLQAGTSK